MILLVGLPEDGPLGAVHNALYRLGRPVAFFDQREVCDNEMEVFVGSDIGGILRIGNRIIDLDTVTAVYLRHYEFCRLPEIEQAGQNNIEWHHALALEDALLSWA